MVTLTLAQLVKSKLGAVDTIGYDKLVVSPVTFDPVLQKIDANLRLTSTINPSMPVLTGVLLVSVPTSILDISISQIGFFRRLTLTSGQNTTILAIIAAAQNVVEDGLITLGLVDGIQLAGV